MDGSLAIERNRVALKRIVASLVAMAGLAVGPEARAGSAAVTLLASPRSRGEDAGRQVGGGGRPLRAGAGPPQGGYNN
jgi:hypothetical protein